VSADLPYGATLTDDEYERAVIALHRGAPAMPTPDEDRRTRRQALDLAVDHRLGREFPAERRQALWEAAERVEAQRLRLGFTFLVRRLFSPGSETHGGALAGVVEQEYGRVLSGEDLKRFLGEGSGARQSRHH